MRVLGGAEIAAGERQHAALDRELFRHGRGGFAREWVADIGEICADRIHLPFLALPERAAEGLGAAMHLAPVFVTPRGQRADAPGERALARAGRADLHTVEDLREIADHGGVGEDGAEATARDAVGLGEAVELDDALAPGAVGEEAVRTSM